MYAWELCRQVLRDMRHHKTRSILAMFGIIWGTVTIVILLALGQGFYTVSKKNMMGFIQGALIIQPGTTTKPYHGFPANRTIHLHADEVMALQSALPEIRYLSPVLSNNQTISYNNQLIDATINGVTPDYAILTKRSVAPGGRFINPIDIREQRNVIFLGTEVKNKLFPNESALGKQVLVAQIPFTVIGVLKKIPNTGMWYNNVVLVPYTTAIKLWGNNDVQQFIVMPNDVNQITLFQQKLMNYLSYQYQIDPTDKNAFFIMNFNDQIVFFNWFFRAIEFFLGFCGLLTLGVGGISVANIMYLIVNERTAEIGLRMSLGANDTHILLQFLLEAGIIVSLGGIIGFLLSIFGVIVLHEINLPAWLGKPELSFTILLTTLIILGVVGLAAGYFPARRAANMTPIQALTF